MSVLQEAAKKAENARKRQRKSGDKSKDSKSAEAKPKSSKVRIFRCFALFVHWKMTPLNRAQASPVMADDRHVACLTK